MRVKFIYESLEYLFKPKSKEEIKRIQNYSIDVLKHFFNLTNEFKNQYDYNERISILHAYNKNLIYNNFLHNITAYETAKELVDKYINKLKYKNQ